MSLVSGASYRPHIDGLRAVAVLGVLIFHLGATWLPGGFVGVDVFYVISGFLITKTILADINNGSFSLANFYQRRIRRIFPAFGVITEVCFVFAWILLQPADFVDFAKSVLASLTFTSNVFFYFQSGYFAPSAETIPLLHYWSLGVEEQFYAIFPLMIVLLARFGKRTIPVVLVCLCVLSIAACEFVVPYDPAAAFYLLPFRAFEILTGSIIALPAVRFRLQGRCAMLTSAIGVGLVVASMALLNEKMRFPSALALFPCVGAAMSILSGGDDRGLAARLLESPIFVFVGKISYSIYLLHWPIIVFGKLLFPNGPQAFPFVAAAVTIGLAWCSYRFVEQPNRNGWFRPRTVFRLAAVTSVILLVAAVTTVGQSGFPERIGPQRRQLLAYERYDYVPVFREGTCFLRPEQPVSQVDLASCVPSKNLPFVLWGSSHIAQFYWGLNRSFEQQGVQFGQLTASGCLPSATRESGSPRCRSFNDFAFATITENRPKVVVIGGDTIAEENLILEMEKTVQALLAIGIRVVVVGPVPSYIPSVPRMLAEKLRAGTLSYSGVVMDKVHSDVFDSDRQLAKRFDSLTGVTYISMLKQFCPEKQCPIFIDGRPLQFDNQHFTREGSELFSSALAGPITSDDIAIRRKAAIAPALN